MNRKIALLLSLALVSVAAGAQSTAKPATATHRTTATRPVSHVTPGVKLPPGVPPVKGPVIAAFTLRYQDIKIGTGPDAEPRKLYKVHYTGWLATDGRKFDSSYDHPGTPIMDKDGKLERDANGQVKMGEPQPISFPQGVGRVIPGFDQGFEGMKVGGKRRLFIPYQLAYGAAGRPGPDPAHPGIPPKADLIFDIELVDVVDSSMPAGHPGIGDMHATPRGNPQQTTTPAHPVTPPPTPPPTGDEQPK
ncbi:MAG TPA: FKBP-type peptidyl-prolyl cis-trans isomerase [Terracidiphilus sp.]|jgi:peptidylprolyl isomerase|nr:FKBP-type peptidyl-prolyl cis-trans isomerase [Terracidiphilus sp.]